MIRKLMLLLSTEEKSALLPLTLCTMGQRRITTPWNGWKLPLLLPKSSEKENSVPSQLLNKQHIKPSFKLKNYHYTPKLGE